jgi:hypothetical protein
LPTSLLIAGFGAGCADPSAGAVDSVDVDAARHASLASPTGFDQWLREQCPDGNTMQITAESGVRGVACEEVREAVLADPFMRERAVSEYLGRTASPERTKTSKAQEPKGGERIGEARGRGLISGFVCSLVISALIARQCDKVGAGWSSCEAAKVPPLILCLVIPIPW